MKNLERLVKGNSRFGGRTDISRGCRCHSRQNIICEQKLAEARILSLTGPIGDDGVLAASLEFWNTDYARRMAKSTAITKLPCDWHKKGI